MMKACFFPIIPSFLFLPTMPNIAKDSLLTILVLSRDFWEIFLL
jgi:hypothetical protein